MMNAPADYREAVAHLTKPLPAYVSYAQHVRARIFGFDKVENETITVRTSDGKVVKGKNESIDIGRDKHMNGSLLTEPPFDPKCYRPRTARLVTYDGHEAEAISLSAVCEHGDHQGDFSVLYVEPSSRVPLAALGTQTDGGVDVHIEQRYVGNGDLVLPSFFAIVVKGSGFMFWLNVDVQVEMTNYSFSSKFP